MYLLSSIVVCFANTVFVTTHLSNSVIMGGEKKKKTSDFLILSRRRAANVSCGGCFGFCFLTDFFFPIYKVVGVFC